jgi:hypothetical protein
MSAEPKKSLAKIRTFARDVEAEREKNGTSVIPSTIQVETPKAAPAASTPIIAREPIAIKEASVHIPAFHEINKKTESPKTSSTTPPTKTSFSVPTVTLVSTEQKKPTPPIREKIIRVQPKKSERRSTRDGTIITDNKNNQIKFLPALVSSFSAWIKSISEAFKKKAPPTYTVTDTQRRKGVIQKATSKTGSIFTADNETLKEQIRKRQAEAKLEKNSEIFWSPHTEAGVPLLEKQNVISPKPVNVQLAFKKRAIPTITVVEPSPVIPLPGPAWESVSPASEPNVMTFVPEPILPPTPPVEVLPVHEVTTPQTEVTQEPVPIFENTETAESPFVDEEKNRSFVHRGFLDRVPGIGVLKRHNTNALTIGVVGFIGGALLTIYIFSGVVQIMFPEALVTTTTALDKPILNGNSVTAVTLPALNRATLEETLNTQPSSDITGNEFSLLDANGVPLSAQTVLAFLAFTINPNFNQSITTLHFGSVSNQSIILLAVSDETTVFGALLEWEPLMARDVGSLISVPRSVSVGRFFDKTIGTTDVRVLEANGNEVLVYGFLSENVVAITPSTTAFQALLNTQQ